MTLVNITPEINWDLDCEEDMCDGYGCDIHDSYSRQNCDSVGCDSTVSTYLVQLLGLTMSLCHYHYYTMKDAN